MKINRYRQTIHMKISQYTGGKKYNCGQNLIEFALLVPLLLLIIFGAVDLARAYHAQVTITNASREGARLAMRINTSLGTQAVKLAAIRQQVVNEAGASGVNVAAGDVAVECQSTGSYTPPCASGTAILVTVDYNFDLLLGGFFIPSFNLSHTTEMVAP